MGRLAKDYRDLDAYSMARAISRDLYMLSRHFPREERFSLTDQMLRASRSIGAQLAEAWAKRRYPKHFISKLTDADSEQRETCHWLEIAAECGYLSDAEAQIQLGRLKHLGKMLDRMIQQAGSFCHPPRTDHCPLPTHCPPPTADCLHPRIPPGAPARHPQFLATIPVRVTVAGLCAEN